ncbi:hypothetical protein G4O51_11440 [Candidatus Bathyarchaeota archaeon A05DMB-2]|jgi:hypothetical protein|nr:hypothetical protein [Candidatus Bathyarchaeota archaeon A05DMB-2]
MGLNIHEFLELTPAEINVKVRAYNKARKQQLADLWNLGMLVALGVNSPKDYPNFEKFVGSPDGTSSKKSQSDELSKEDKEAFRSRLRRRGLRV